MLHATCHTEKEGWVDVPDLTHMSELRSVAGNLLWAEVDVGGLTPEDTELLAEEFSLHPLAVEDATESRHRPKLESYGKDLFMVIHQLDEADGQLEPVQISCFVGDRYVLTFHEGATRTLDEAKRRWQEDRPANSHPSDLLHVLVDVVVDDYQAIADRLEDEMENLEEIVLAAPHAPVSRQLYSVKQRLARLRRYVLPGARLLDWAVDPDSRRPFTDETAARFRDVHDNLMRVTDQIRNVDELAQAVLDLTKAEQATALNETTRKLSAWASIFAAATVIAGVYGMNYKLLPRADTSLFGFLFAIGLMVVTCGILYVNFKKREWL